MKSSVRSARRERKTPLHFVCHVPSFCVLAVRGDTKEEKDNSWAWFVSVDKAMKGKMKASVLCCERHHHHLEINTYCHMDRQAICAECILDHKGHDVDRIVNVVQGFKDEIAQLVDEVCSVFFFLSLVLFFFFFLFFFFLSLFLFFFFLLLLP